ncbi:MAG: calcium-binding protein, partial [Nitrospirae bacterium]
ADEGTDTVQASIDYTLGANLENLTLTGAANISGTGNDLANTLTGNSGANHLIGLGGNDRLTGNDSDDTLDGGDGNDTLNGGLGADLMTGGLGNDVYVVDNAGDRVTENADEGADTVQSSIDYTLGANLENLTLTGTARLNGTGNDLANTLTGNSGANHLIGLGGNDRLTGNDSDDTLDGGDGNDTLNGGLGADLMSGGLGNDVFVVDNAGDRVTEGADEGTDTVQASIDYTLGANLENLTLTGAANLNGTGNDLANTLTGNSGANHLIGLGGNDRLTGNDSDDTLDGGDGNDTLNGGLGADLMSGGLGNDVYVVDNAGDRVVEGADEGTDTVQASIDYTLGANLENLTLTGSADISGTGNDLANTLTGNSGANHLIGLGGNDRLTGNDSDDTLDGGDGNDTLNGGLGADLMSGGQGNDVYVVDNVGDQVVEGAEEGTDTVQAGIDYILGANLENLTLTGAADISGAGNDLANTLTGNAGANYLWGGLGADKLSGGAGADLLQGGADNDALSDSGGNNLLDGGAGVDTLTGNAGNELFIGGTGNDTLTTGTGADVLAFNRGDGQDIVKGSADTDNTLSLGGGIRYADLLFSKSSNNLVLTTGAGENITFQNWYAATPNHSVLTLQVIAEAMAGYDANSTDTLLNKKVQEFDFTALVNAFDAARTANSTLKSWNLMDSLLNAHLAASDTMALGGDLAYQYGLNGSLTGMSLGAAQEVMSGAQFGSQTQALRPWAGLTGGAVQLG